MVETYKKRRKHAFKCQKCGHRMKRHYRNGKLSHVECGKCGWSFN